MSKKVVNSIHIKEKDIIASVTREQKLSGRKTTAKMASVMIGEQARQLEYERATAADTLKQESNELTI